ncbi:hypothetical protein [Streptacidiphilus sp. EB129]|uniref:hypothetical protein n=1 Tax=Streptacidiphilus sp. EB129 TaxID=3156262 RepID=UPI0035195909
MSTTSPNRKLLASAVVLSAAAAIAVSVNTSSYAVDNAGANTDPVVSTTAATQPFGTQGTLTTTATGPVAIAAAQVLADSTFSVTPSDVGGLQSFAVSSSPKGATLTRSQVMARAQSWVNEGVPYDQQGYKTDANGTYREDCSGFVSMAWNLPYSRTTWTLDDSSIATQISQSDLKPGDILDYPDVHVILFAGWKDQSAGTFYYYAESNPSVLTNEYIGNFNSGNGTIAGWLIGDYEFLRYNNIVDDRTPPPAPPGVPAPANRVVGTVERSNLQVP